MWRMPTRSKPAIMPTSSSQLIQQRLDMSNDRVAHGLVALIVGNIGPVGRLPRCLRSGRQCAPDCKDVRGTCHVFLADRGWLADRDFDTVGPNTGNCPTIHIVLTSP